MSRQSGEINLDIEEENGACDASLLALRNNVPYIDLVVRNNFDRILGIILKNWDRIIMIIEIYNNE